MSTVPLSTLFAFVTQAFAPYKGHVILWWLIHRPAAIVFVRRPLA